MTVQLKMNKKICVTGAAGFIGNHLVNRLKQDDYYVQGIDIKYPQWGETKADKFILADLRKTEEGSYLHGFDWVFALAADMGGMGFISNNHAQIITNNTRINLTTIEAAYKLDIKRYLFSSSACVYPDYLQDNLDIGMPLKENEVYPADPQDAYGWEKLHGEHLCKYYKQAGWLDTRIVRFHNCYGKLGLYQGGREKAPAAICRKVAIAKLTGQKEIEIWGDGEQVRSFMYIDDCVEGLIRLMKSDYSEPLNLGSSQAVTINRLVEIVSDIAEYPVEIKHVPGPEGVRFRNSDNSLCKQILDFEPQIRLEEGLIPTYQWIEEQVRKDRNG